MFFNQKLPTGHKIEITYRHFVDIIRLKAVFIRGGVSDETAGITPVLKEYRFDYRVLE